MSLISDDSTWRAVVVVDMAFLVSGHVHIQKLLSLTSYSVFLNGPAAYCPSRQRDTATWGL